MVRTSYMRIARANYFSTLVLVSFIALACFFQVNYTDWYQGLYFIGLVVFCWIFMLITFNTCCLSYMMDKFQFTI